MAKVNYVIPCWDGDRHQGMDRYFEADRSLYIRVQIHQLSSLQHNLDQITFVRCANSPGKSEFIKVLQDLPTKIGTANVVTINTDIDGWSYGAFAEAYERYRTTFDYYIFCEDDYVVVMDNFDEFLINFLESYPKCGYACSFEHKEDGVSFGTVSNGIIRSIALEDNRAYHNGLVSHFSQTDFGHGFWRVNWPLCSLCPKIRSPYWAGHNKREPWRGLVVRHCNGGEVSLWEPVQLVLQKKASLFNLGKDYGFSIKYL